MSNDERLTRVEESQAFAERTIEQLSEELVRAFKRLDDLTARLEDLGSRLADVESMATPGADSDEPDEPGLERPPHSAGPRD